jgi:hypothetical protein
VGAVRYLLTIQDWKESPAREAMNIGALQRYDRPQPRLADYDQLQPNWPLAEVIQ